MLKKFQNSKIAKTVGCLVLAVVIYYVMTDGFSSLSGETSGAGASSLSAGGYGWKETLAAGILVLWMLVVIGKSLWERRRGRPKNDVNVKY